jgi:hypothetical protein
VVGDPHGLIGDLDEVRHQATDKPFDAAHRSPGIRKAAGLERLLAPIVRVCNCNNHDYII